MKRWISLLLALVMIVGMLPMTAMTASAATTDPIWVGGVKMSNGTYLANGATKTTTTKPSGGYAHYKGGTLTLNNYSYSGEGTVVWESMNYNAAIYSTGELTLHLMGSNRITGTSATYLVNGIRPMWMPPPTSIPSAAARMA